MIERRDLPSPLVTEIIEVLGRIGTRRQAACPASNEVIHSLQLQTTRPDDAYMQLITRVSTASRRTAAGIVTWFVVDRRLNFFTSQLSK